VRVSLAGKALKAVSLDSAQTRKHRLIEIGQFATECAGKVRIEIVSRRKPMRIDGFAAIRNFG
jgi:hypothetical protein